MGGLAFSPHLPFLTSPASTLWFSQVFTGSHSWCWDSWQCFASELEFWAPTVAKAAWGDTPLGNLTTPSPSPPAPQEHPLGCCSAHTLGLPKAGAASQWAQLADMAVGHARAQLHETPPLFRPCSPKFFWHRTHVALAQASLGTGQALVGQLLPLRTGRASVGRCLPLGTGQASVGWHLLESPGCSHDTQSPSTHGCTGDTQVSLKFI